MDLIIDTASADHDINVYFGALAVDGPCPPRARAGRSESMPRRASHEHAARAAPPAADPERMRRTGVE